MREMRFFSESCTKNIPDKITIFIIKVNNTKSIIQMQVMEQ